MEKKNSVLGVLVILLSVVVLGLTGFIVYDKALNKDAKEENNNTNNNVVETFDNIVIKNSEIKELYNYVQPSLKSNNVCLGYFYQNPYKNHTMDSKISLVLLNYAEKYEKTIDEKFLQKISESDRELVKNSSDYYVEPDIVKEGLKILFNIDIDKFDNKNYALWQYRDDANAFVNGSGGGNYSAKVVQQVIDYNELNDEINLTVVKAEILSSPQNIIGPSGETTKPAGIYRYVNNTNTLVISDNIENFEFSNDNISKFPQLKYVFKKNTNGKYYVSDIINLNFEEDYEKCN